MPECECGAHVSDDFVRVFCIDNEVHACPACDSATNVKRGSAAGRTPQPIIADGSGRIGGRR